MFEVNDVRWKQRFENYERAYHSLVRSENALKLDEGNEFIQDSLIQRYEYTIELAWKTMKDYLEFEGFVDVSSPKKAVRKAFQEEIIKDGSGWIKALNDRNRTSHAYEESMANEISNIIRTKHIPIFRDFYLCLKDKVDA